MHLYIRTAQGQTYNAENAREAVDQFLSEDGYRLSIVVDGVTFVLRKDCPLDSSIERMDSFLDQRSAQCLVTIRHDDSVKEKGEF